MPIELLSWNNVMIVSVQEKKGKEIKRRKKKAFRQNNEVKNDQF